MARRRSWKTPLMLVALAAAAGHVYFWYWPRERPADPGKGGPAVAMVLSESALPLCAWVPYPHQNLAGMSRGDSPLSNLAAAMQTLRGDRRRAMPGFGPFPLPPGHGLGLCSDREGNRLRLIAEVYPLLATLARWSGHLAANPWLAGGEVESGGRRLVVRWEGNVWTVADAASAGLTPGTEPAASPGAAGEEAGRVLGLARLRRPWGAVPAGLYRIERRDGDLALRSAHLPRGSASGTVARVAPLSEGIPLVSVIVDDVEPRRIRVMAMVEGAGKDPDRLPGFVVLHRGSGERWRLPREALGPLLDLEARESTVAGWTTAALDDEALAWAERLATELGSLEEPARAGLVAALWVDPGRVGPTMHRLADDLERLPIVKRRYVRAWRAAALAAGALESSHLLTLAVVAGQDAPALELRLHAPPVAPRTTD